MKFQRQTFVESGLVMALAASAFLLSACSQNGAGSSAQPQESAPSGGTAIATSATFSPFTGTIPQTLENKQCSLDLINNQATSSVSVADGSTVIFGGWAGNGRGQAADKFELVLKGAQQSYFVPLTTGVQRPDVAKALNSEAMTGSGYNLAANLASVQTGTYSLYVVDPASTASDCDLHRTLTVQ